MRVDVPVIAPYSLDNATQTGTGNVWADASDATYIDIAGTGSNPVAYRASGVISNTGRPHVPESVLPMVRIRSTGAIPSASIILFGDSYYHAGYGEPDPVPGWLRVPFTNIEITQAFNGGYDLAGQVNSHFGDPNPVRVFEVFISWEWFTDAPPCRILQRSDGLGVGAGRAYPPAKSQQRSPGNRGVSYY